MSELTIDYRTAADGDVLHLRGRATYREAHELRDKLFAAIAARPSGRVVLELSAVEVMDTAALAVLVEGILATRRKETELFFCTPSESVRQIFALTGLEEALTRCYGCLDEALKASAPAA
ncbi:MAG TPA: STAS domain-containing protein [Thermoanaerobaculia bacterium]|jgi:anti-anti-sigma factor